MVICGEVDEVAPQPSYQAQVSAAELLLVAASILYTACYPWSSESLVTYRPSAVPAGPFHQCVQFSVYSKALFTAR
jgi:hypothetical protein